MRRAMCRATMLTLLLAIASCGEDGSVTDPRVVKTFTTPTGLITATPPEILVGAGDISDCSKTSDEATASLVDNIPGTVFVLGDNVYENGTASEYQNCYGPNWGRHKARTKPSAGNHDYNTNGASGYYSYFGAAAGDPSKGYYTYEAGAWHVIVLNSNISMTATSAQTTWLKADLAAHSNLCTLAYFHHPLYSSTGGSGSGGVTYSSVRPLVDALYAGGADLMLAGHRHFYERLAPIKPSGARDDVFGVREIIAGMGGKSGGSVTNVFPASEARNGVTFGVLKLYLYEDGYAWKFIGIPGSTFTDSGSTACHGAPGGSPPPVGGVSASRSTVAVSPETITAASGANAATITVVAKDANGNPVSGATVVLAVGGSHNTLTQPSGPTGADGVATGTISSDVAQAKIVSATINGVAITQTDTLTVSPDQPATLAFKVQPGTTAPGATITPAVAVEVRDQFGNAVTNAVNDVTLAIGINPGGSGTLSGTTTATAVGGVATFGDLSIAQEGVGYTLAASATGLSGVQSRPFDITTSTVVAITQPLLTVGSNAVNQKIYTTGVISPSPNTLVTVAVLELNSSAAPPLPTLSGGGMAAWTVVASTTFDTGTLPLRRVTIFRALSATPGSDAITITSSVTLSNCEWIVSQWGGVDLSGVNGAGAIGQTGATTGEAVSGLTVPLAAFGNANNVGYGVFGVRSNVAVVTPGAGFTEIAEQPSGESTPGDLQAEWAANLNGITATWASLNGAALGVEIRARTTP